MNPDDLAHLVGTCLERTVPDADVASLDRAADLRDQLDVDSMDMLRFVRAVAEATSLDIPETDARQMVTLDGAVAYLTRRLATQA